MAHPAEAFVGVPYDAETMDCADFVALVRQQLHGHQVVLPNGRPRGVAGQRALGALSQPYADPTDTPEDGDLVLMRRGRLWHVGLVYRIGSERHVLHAMDETSCSVLTPVRDLPALGLRFEGFYSWRM